MDMEIYRKQYDFEMEQRNGIASATNIPIVALTIIGGALSSVVIGYKFSNTLSSNVFLLTTSLSALCILWTVYYVARSFIGYVYQKIPPSKQLTAYYVELKGWHFANGNTEEESRRLAKLDFDDYLKERFSEASERNGNNNIMRGNYLHGSTVTVCISFFLLAVSSPFYIYQKVSNEDQIYQVNIMNQSKQTSEEIKMSNKNDTTNESTNETTNEVPSTPAETSPSVDPGQKPQGPANWEFKGNADIGNIRTKTGGSNSASDD